MSAKGIGGSFLESDVFRFSAVKGNSLRLDGGAMFGNAPKALWKRWIEVDADNRIPIASRALLIETGDHKILFETGCGAYLSPEMKKRFQVCESEHVLEKSLETIGVTHEQITHVILSHLHFDHSGGLLKAWESDAQPIELIFPNAQFFIGRENFERSKAPHNRDRASFIPGLADLLEQSGRLNLICDGDRLELDDLKIEWQKSHGHTPGMMVSKIRTPDQIVYFIGDLAPGLPWINLPITMGYDRFPEKLIDEKIETFKRIESENAWVFYTHDHQWAASQLAYNDEKKRFEPICPIADFTRLQALKKR